MDKITVLNVENNQSIIVVLEDSSDFSTETNTSYLVPLKWAEEKQFNRFDGRNIPIELKNELEQFKIKHIKSFY